MNIILASASPRRKQLLKELGVKFKVVESGFNENIKHNFSPAKFVKVLALGKAREVAKQYKNAIIIGADTIVYHKGKILGKPKDKKHAIKMLKSLSGHTHKVFTGVAVVDTKSGKVFNQSVSVKVGFRKLSENEIKNYIKTEKPYDKAGAYAIQEKAKVFVSKVNGEYTAIIGLPVPLMLKFLNKLGIKV